MKRETYDSLAKHSINDLIINGPCNANTLNCLSLLKYINEDRFKSFENNVLAYMGLYYKNILFDKSDIYDLVFKLIGDAIYDKFKQKLTPFQAEIKQTVMDRKVFMFSAPTSIGKSFLLRDILVKSNVNVVVIVPTRALMNEYVLDIKAELLKNNIRDCNVLSFFEIINTKHASRNIFVLTPERCFDLFSSNIEIGLFIFDEAQLIDSAEGIRSIKFRSLLKKISSKFPNVKKLFAYPFVKNLDDVKNYLFPDEDVLIKAYSYQNVGQLFTYITPAERYYAFNLTNDEKVPLDDDPIEYALKNNGKILVYTSKASIYSGRIYSEIKKYIDLLGEKGKFGNSTDAYRIIKLIAEKIGAAKGASKLVENMENGIVIHHGSLPHTVRTLIEEFIRKGYARICISTTTLEQGVNMPFDVVYIHHFYNLKTSLDIKNLIGRAGRSTVGTSFFDYGIIVTRNKKDFIRRVKPDVKIDVGQKVSVSEDDEELKRAIENDDLDNESNLPSSLIERLSKKDIYDSVHVILELLFDSNNKIKKDFDTQHLHQLMELFYQIYVCRLKNERPMTELEKMVFDETIRILIFKLQKLKFSEIVLRRFSYIKSNRFRYVRFLQLPDNRTRFSKLFDKVDNKEYFFDIVVCDTYEYIDKNINLYFKDVLLGALLQYEKQSPGDEREKNLLSLIRYGSDNYNEIMLYKYGFADEEIDVLKDRLLLINEEEVVFNCIDDLDNELKEKCRFYIY